MKMNDLCLQITQQGGTLGTYGLNEEDRNRTPQLSRTPHFKEKGAHDFKTVTKQSF